MNSRAVQETQVSNVWSRGPILAWKNLAAGLFIFGAFALNFPAHAGCEDRLGPRGHSLVMLIEKAVDQKLLSLDAAAGFAAEAGWEDPFDMRGELTAAMYSRAFHEIAKNLDDAQKSEVKSATRAMLKNRFALSETEGRAKEDTRSVVAPQVLVREQADDSFMVPSERGYTVGWVDGRPVLLNRMLQSDVLDQMTYYQFVFDPLRADKDGRLTRFFSPHIRYGRTPYFFQEGSESYLAYLSDGVIYDLRTGKDVGDRFHLEPIAPGERVDVRTTVVSAAGDTPALSRLERNRTAVSTPAKDGRIEQRKLKPLNRRLSRVGEREFRAVFSDTRILHILDSQREFSTMATVDFRETHGHGRSEEEPVTKVFDQDGRLYAAIAGTGKQGSVFDVSVVDLETMRTVRSFPAARVDGLEMIRRNGRARILLYRRLLLSPNSFQDTYELQVADALTGEISAREIGTLATDTRVFHLRDRSYLVWGFGNQLHLMDIESGSVLRKDLEDRPLHVELVEYRDQIYAFVHGSKTWQLVQLLSR